MATGRLGVSDLAATTYTTLYTAPSDTFSVATVSICNRGSSVANIRLAITTTAGPSAPANEEFIEYDVQLSAKGTLERTGLVLDAGKIISVYSSAVNVSAVAYGIETSTV
jgi:hypothetical protein